MKCFVALVLLSIFAIFATAQESEGFARRDVLENSEEADFIRDILIAFEPFLEKRGLREPSEYHRPGGYERGEHRGRGRHRGHHGWRNMMVMVPLYEECQNFTSSLRSKVKEMYSNREIGPSQCQGNFGECVKNDMEKVRCRVTVPPSAECIAKVTQYMQGASCTENEGNGGSGGGNGGSGGGNGGNGGGNGGSGGGNGSNGGGNGGSGGGNGGNGGGNGGSEVETDP